MEDRKVENLDEPIKVYNFQVEDFHTYHVGENGVLVHNADYDKNLISTNMQDRIPNDEVDAPTQRGNAPTSTKDGKPIEIHHYDQNPNGPFKEMSRTDHRCGDNYKINHPYFNEKTKIDRSNWKRQVREYWNNEWDRGRWN